MAQTEAQAAPTNTAANEGAAPAEKPEAGYEWPIEDVGKWFSETVASKKLTMLVYFRGHW